MVGRCHKSQIVDNIIRFVSINVMDNLMFFKFAANMNFHYKPVRKDSTALVWGSVIPVGGKTSALKIRVILSPHGGILFPFVMRCPSLLGNVVARSRTIFSSAMRNLVGIYRKFIFANQTNHLHLIFHQIKNTLPRTINLSFLLQCRLKFVITNWTCFLDKCCWSVWRMSGGKLAFSISQVFHLIPPIGILPNLCIYFKPVFREEPCL